MVFGTGALSYSWWGNLQWHAQVDEENWGEVESYADLDVAEPTDKLFIRSWDGEDEGGSKITEVTFAQIVAAVQSALSRGLLDVTSDGVTEDLGLFDANEADLVLQLAVFGEPVYG